MSRKKEIEECPHYGYSEYLAKVLKRYGHNFYLLEKFKDGNQIMISSEDHEVMKIVEKATDFYFGKNIAKTENVDNSIVVVFDCKEKEQNALSKKFNFALPPREKDNIVNVYKKLCEVYPSKKYKVFLEDEGFRVYFNDEKLTTLSESLSLMGWKIEERESGFFIRL